MLARPAFALAMVVACGPPSPVNGEVDGPGGAGAALELVRDEWGARIGKSLARYELPSVRWFAPPDDGPSCLVYEGDPAFDVGGTCLDGRYFDHEIHLIHRPERVSLADSSLAHEALHWGLSMREGMADACHHFPVWRQQGEVADAVRAAGL